MINPLDYPTFLSLPLRLVKPHWWLQHAPFAMFLVDLARPKLLVELGTHTGTSYSAFCQAVKELSLDTKCYAIDNWKGDPHEGYYGEDVLENLKAFHDPLYGKFSSLVQTTFDDAMHLFDDKSIDILHIDGYHTYDAVKHDFETWLTKMSPKGIVMLHDTAVRQENFGVWKYWSELKEQYPSFEFIHGMGLGIVFVGTEPVGDIRKLFSMSEDEVTRFQNFFFNFGLKISTIVEKEEQLQVAYTELQESNVSAKEQTLQSLTALVAEKERIVQSLTALVAEKERIVQSLTALVAEKEQIVRSLTAQVAEEERALKVLTMHAAEREHDLQEIRSSKAWKLALILRRIRVALIPPNSLRSKVLRRLINPIIFLFRIVKRNRRPEENLGLARSSDTDENVKTARKNSEVGYIAQPTQEFQTASTIIDMTQNQKINDIAVIVHLFYEDLFEEIKNYLQNLDQFDLYISMPGSKHRLKDEIFATYPNAKIFYTENRGRDIYPFISIYKNISLLNYDYILKIHTKKSPHREDGGIWRTDIYNKLMGSAEIINSVLSAFEDDQTIGIIGPKGHVIDYRIYWGSNKQKTQKLARRVGISLRDDHSFNFVAGSMFWAKPEALRYLSLLPIEYEEFEPEPLGPDGALVHALERFIGLTVDETGYSVYESDNQGNISDPRKNPPDISYPFGEADDAQVAGLEKMAQLQNSDKNSIYRLAGPLRKIRLVGSLIYSRSEKIFRIFIEVIKNPRDPRIRAQLSHLMRVLKDRRKPLDYSHQIINDQTSQAIHEEVEVTEQLAEKLLKCISNQEYIISISQSNYLQVVGGVEIMITDEQKAYNKNGIVYLHIFPFLMPHPRLISEDEPLYIGVNCNGERLGVTDREGLLSALNELNSEQLTDIIIHHTMGFDITLINRILEEIGGKKGRFWLHDNFSLCPGYTLLRNDLTYCGAPDINSNACLICKYGKMRKIQQPAFKMLFEENKLEVVAPSTFTINFWKEKSKIKTNSEKVIPHMNLNWKGTTAARQFNAPLRIGFLGYPVYWKGWDTWLRLVNKFSKDVRYQFYCFTSWPSTTDKMKWVSVSVTKDNRLSMVEALKDNQIDVAFLWSLCPETFSFTLYESLAAGCFVLTYKDSGNIQSYLKQNPNQGLVLEDEQALVKLFFGNDIYSLVTDYQKNGRPQGEIVFLPEFE